MKKNRLAGILYLCMILFGIFAQVVRSNIFVFNDVVNTLGNNQSLLFPSSLFILRLALISDLLMAVFYLLTAWVLFKALKHINKNQSFLFLIFTVISVAILSMNMINHIAIIEVNTVNYGFDVQSITQFFAKLRTYGYLISQLFFGLWLLPLGMIILKSKIMPKFFGIMLIAATFGHLIEVFTTFLFQGNDFIIYPGLLIAMLGEFSFCFWLIYKGIDIQK